MYNNDSDIDLGNVFFEFSLQKMSCNATERIWGIFNGE